MPWNALGSRCASILSGGLGAIYFHMVKEPADMRLQTDANTG